TGSINESASAISAGTFQLPAGATFTRSGGTVGFTTFTHNGGTLNWSGGDLIVSAASGANYNLTGGTLAMTSSGMRIGTSIGAGSSEERRVGKAGASDIMLGYDTSFTGTYNLSATGTVSSTNIYVGGNNPTA